MSKMLDSCGMDGTNYDNTLISWADQKVQTDVYLGVKGLKYCSGYTSIKVLKDDKACVIRGDQPVN